MSVTAEDEARGLADEAARPAFVDSASIATGSASEAVHGLIAEVRQTLRTEVMLAKTAAKVASAAAGRVAIWGLVAAVLIFVALLAGTAALILVLADAVGPVASAALVAFALFSASGFAAWRARANVLRLQRVAAMVSE